MTPFFRGWWERWTGRGRARADRPAAAAAEPGARDHLPHDMPHDVPHDVPHEAPCGARQPMLDCEAVMRQLWDYLDGELTAERLAAVQEHLALCEHCHPHVEFERSFLAAVARSRRRHSDPARLRHDLLHALRARGMSEA